MFVCFKGLNLVIICVFFNSFNLNFFLFSNCDLLFYLYFCVFHFIKLLYLPGLPFFGLLCCFCDFQKLIFHDVSLVFSIKLSKAAKNFYSVQIHQFSQHFSEIPYSNSQYSIFSTTDWQYLESLSEVMELGVWNGWWKIPLNY